MTKGTAHPSSQVSPGIRLRTREGNKSHLEWSLPVPAACSRAEQRASVTRMAQKSTIDLGSVNQTYSRGIIELPLYVRLVRE